MTSLGPSSRRRHRPGARAIGAGALAVTCIGAAALTGCVDGGGGSTSSPGCEPSDIPAHDDRTIVIEGDPWSGYAPFRDEDLLDGTGYTAQYVEQLCQDVRAADVTAGRAGIAVTTLDQYVLNQPDGTVVGVIDQSAGADALVLNTVDLPDLDSIDDLPELVEQYEQRDDKPVLAYTGNSPSEMLLNELANTSEELRLADFELVSVDQSSTAYEMLQDNRAQLAVVWEPDTSAARAAGYTVALSSEDAPDSIVDVIVASNVLIEQDPDAVRAVVRSYYTAMDRYLASPTDLERFIADDGGLDLEAARSVIAGIKLYGTHDAEVFMNESEWPLDQPQVDQSLSAISSLLALVRPDVQLGRAEVDGRFVHELTQ
jgi:OOP family OmpA-OmpF porin